MKHIRICSAVLATALALSLTGCQGNGDSSSEDATPAGVAVQVQEVAIDTISTESRVSGTVTTDSDTSIYVAATAKCTAVYVEAGDTVSAGDRICTLDMASTLSSYNAANISYQSAVQSYQDQAAIFDTQIALAEKNVSDLQALFEIGAASQAEIDSAQLNLMTLQASRDSTLAQLEAGIQTSQSNVEQLSTVLENVDAGGNVIAPASDTVTSLSAVKDGYVSASMPVAVIDGAEVMEVSVSVSEALLPKLAIGDEADVTVSALDTSFVGTIRSIEQTANVQTKLYGVTVSVPAEVTDLRSGMFADVSFRTDTSADTIVIPTEAILTSGQDQYVFVVEDGTARQVPVRTGLTGSGVTEITEGLEDGQQLVTVGQEYLSDGEAVRIVSGEG